MQNCNGTPLSGNTFTVYYNRNYLFNTTENLGKITTDANGLFKLENIPVNRNRLLEFDGSGISFKNIGFGKPEAGSIKDIGTLYREYETNVRFHLIPSRSFGFWDTLYFGYSASNYTKIYPIKDTILYLKRAGNYGGDVTIGAKIYTYAIGHSKYRKGLKTTIG